jgi:hypothetical protein
MQVFLITIITLVVTFFLNPVFKRVSKQRPMKLHIHHSVLGVLILVIGIIASNKIAIAIGLGIYLGHVMEEMYFNKRSLITALFIFVTR